MEFNRIALTGGIASGKSAVGKMLSDAGLPVIDADDVVHDLWRTDAELKQKTVDTFGQDVLAADNTVDRKKVGQKVFARPEWRKLLESWIHPKVRQRIEAFFEQAKKQGHKMGVAMIPLLFESNLAQYYDEVWLVNVDREQQVKRMMAYRHMSRQDAEARLNSQMSGDEKLARLEELARSGKKTFVLDNNGTLEALRGKVLEKIRSL